MVPIPSEYEYIRMRLLGIHSSWHTIEPDPPDNDTSVFEDLQRNSMLENITICDAVGNKQICKATVTSDLRSAGTSGQTISPSTTGRQSKEKQKTN